MTKLEKLFERASEFAVDTFKASGEVMPMWIAQDGKGEVIPILTPFTNDEEKDVTADAVREIFKKVGAVRCAFISEAWMLVGDKNNKMPEGPIREHPNRVEALVITVEDNVGVSIMGSYPILRPIDGKPRLGPLTKNTMKLGGGRFSGLLMPTMESMQ